MRRFNPFEFYELGSDLRRLTVRVEADLSLSDAFQKLNGGRNWLRRLLSNDLITLTLSRHAAQSLLIHMDAVYRAHYCDASGNVDLDKDWKSGAIGAWHWNYMSDKVSKFEHVLQEELRGTMTYFVPKRSFFDTADLMENAEAGIPPDLLVYVNDTARKDYLAAGKCLALDLCTACGFHAVRAVEGVLGDYFETFCGPPPKKSMTMNDYIVGLRAKRDADGAGPMPDDKTLANLDQVRVYERNPVAHPRITLDATDALNVFHKSTSAIIEMAKEMKAAKAGAELPALTLVAGGHDGG